MENKQYLEGLQMIITQLSQQADGHMIQSRVFKAEGFNKLADKYAEHATEERGYVQQCIDRLLDLGCEVKLEAKAEGKVCKDPVEWIKYDLQVSKDGLAALAPMIEEARQDYTTYDILVKYYQDEEEDMYWGEAQLELIECIGRNNWLVQQL
ncbi:bacterioferritin (cytochrome b1) [Sharpea azabuensis]|jgi:bacterioferritin|uniref:Bacterioferritin (Cytochrome b1) n=1 Tax=Sharpea porci TaxID=2652286 RepID=A0A844FSX7_9FIRM|nr:ferritin-like domain-containing protein [Sharpea porci]MDD6712327.1 ferritin-like domain-containing protein [Sharpea porci]MST88686.1 bacterioferritin (cytochrome b1) [Sharpea porci]